MAPSSRHQTTSKLFLVHYTMKWCAHLLNIKALTIFCHEPQSYFTIVVSETAVFDVFLIEMSVDGALVGAVEKEVIAVDTVAAVISKTAVATDWC